MTSLTPHKIGLFSLVLPTYDERENIVRLIEVLLKTIPVPMEIIVVDDNSPDGTSQAVRDFIQAHPEARVRVETRMSDRGLTNSIRRGIELATGDTVGWMDCDFSHPAGTMAELVLKVEEGYDMAIASRFIAGGDYKRGLGFFGADESALAVLLSRLINWFIRMSLYPGFHDYTSGFIAVRTDIVRTLDLRGDYGEYFIDFIYRAIKTGYSFKEVPFISPPRTYGVSKTGTTFRQLFRRGKKYVHVVRALWHWRPDTKM
jgi:dolichol-phosphate mannosyltransferase